MAELLFKDEVYAIVGAAMEVHREKGFGFSEPVYQECMEFELADRGISAIAQKEMPIPYRGRRRKTARCMRLLVRQWKCIAKKGLGSRNRCIRNVWNSSLRTDNRIH